MITVEDVEHVAKLARLELTDDEKQKFTEQLDNILDYFNQLDELDTTGVEPLSHPIPIFNVIREDSPTEFNEREIVLNNAPEEEDGYFRVPKISE